jgi:hypothetical protein
MQEEQGVAALIYLLLNTLATPLYEGLRISDLVTVGVWYIWWERRKVKHGETVQDPRRSAQSIAALSLNLSRVKNNRVLPMVRHGWIKPPEGIVKLNVDAALDVASGEGGTGAVIRDHSGFFVAGGRWTLQHVEDVASLRNGLLLAGEVGCNRILVESDCPRGGANHAGWGKFARSGGGNLRGVCVLVSKFYSCFLLSLS